MSLWDGNFHLPSHFVVTSCAQPFQHVPLLSYIVISLERALASHLEVTSMLELQALLVAISSTTRQVVSASAPSPPCSCATRRPQRPSRLRASRDAVGNRAARSVAAARGPISRAATAATRSCHACCSGVRGK